MLLNLMFSLDKIQASGDTVEQFTSLCVGSVTMNQQRQDASAIVELLSPDGVLFQLFHTMYRKKIHVGAAGIEMFKDQLMSSRHLENGAKKYSNPNLPHAAEQNLPEVSAFELYRALFYDKIGSK